jgi:hypothetical protein
MKHKACYAPTSRLEYRGVYIRIAGNAIAATYRLECGGGALLASNAHGYGTAGYDADDDTGLPCGENQTAIEDATDRARIAADVWADGRWIVR